MRTKSILNLALLLSGACVASFGIPAQAHAAQERPSLLIMSQPVPESLKNGLAVSSSSLSAGDTVSAPDTASDISAVRTASVPQAYAAAPAPFETSVYTNPVAVREIKTMEVVGKTYFEPTSTLVTQKVGQIDRDLGALHARVVSLAAELKGLEKRSDDRAAEYYAAVATINTQLQSGTTPGNPRLVQKLSVAEDALQSFSAGMESYNKIALDVSHAASEAQFLLEETRSAYGIYGAVEEDHLKLAQTEDTINNTLVMIERVLNTVSDDLRRTGAYVNSERDNLRTLALGVTNGDLYGRNLTNRPFSSAQPFGQASAEGASAAPMNMHDMASAPVAPVQSEELVVSSNDYAEQAPVTGMAATGANFAEPRILAKIRFDNPDVPFEQPLYVAVNDALERYPDAKFDLVAVHPSQGNAAQVAIESTRARRNAEKVLRTLTQMGLPSDRINLSYTDDAAIDAGEVRLFVK